MNRVRKGQHRNLEGELVTVDQMAEIANLGTNTIRRLAQEAGAVRKIGKSYRINRKIFFEFIETVYSK